MLAAAAALAVNAAPANAAAPPLRATASILVQPDTGDIVASHAVTSERPIASTTKLMTALLTLERASLSDVLVAVPYRAQPAESLVGLRAGEHMKVADLLRGLLLQSGNDAALTLATRIAGSERAFVRLMNTRAAEIGLHHTHYANPIGLDNPGNYSSAADLAALAQRLLRNKFFAETVDMPSVTLRSGLRVRRFNNRNTLVREVSWVNGVKTGHTRKAGNVLVASGRRDGVRLITVVLGEPSEGARNADSLALLQFGLRRYHSVTVLRRGQVLARPGLDYRSGHIDVVASRAVTRVLKRGERTYLRATGVPDELKGSHDAGTRVGTVLIRQRGRTVDRVALVTATAVSAASLGDRITSFFSGPAAIVLLLVALACSLQLGLMRRRATRRARARARERKRSSTPA